MKLLLFLLNVLAAPLCQSSTELTRVYARPGTMASLPCPQRSGDVTWSYLEGGAKRTLVDIRDGQEHITNKNKYGSQANNVLLIKRVNSTDSRMYFCNKSQIYLFVTTDPNLLTPGNKVSTSDEVDSDGSGLKEDSDSEDSGIHGDVWKVCVGVMIGAVSVLLVLVTLRFCSKRRPKKDNATVEVVYEEIQGVEDRGGRGSEVESPYWTSETWTLSSSTPTTNNLYSTVNKSKDPSGGECVYYLAQDPAQTGGSGDL